MRRLLTFTLVGLAAQTIDGSLGMAYGATSATLLVAAGYTPVLVSASGSITGRPTVVRVDGRVAPASARPSPDVFRADTTVPPASGTSPTKVAVALTTIAVAALLVALLLLSSLRRGSAVAGDDSLARAIRLVRESAHRPEADRRRAADLLARTAGDRDRRPLAAEATRIAWAPSLPTSRTVEDLAASATRETT